MGQVLWDTSRVDEDEQDSYDRVSDVVENGVRFASKILTHNRMH